MGLVTRCEKEGFMERTSQTVKRKDQATTPPGIIWLGSSSSLPSNNCSGQTLTTQTQLGLLVVHMG